MGQSAGWLVCPFSVPAYLKRHENLTINNRRVAYVVATERDMPSIMFA